MLGPTAEQRRRLAAALASWIVATQQARWVAMADVAGALSPDAQGNRECAPPVGASFSAGSPPTSTRGLASLTRAASQGHPTSSTAGSSDGSHLHWALDIARTPSSWSPQSPSLRGLGSPSSAGSSAEAPATGGTTSFLPSFQASIRWGRPASAAGHGVEQGLAAFTAKAQAASVTVAKAFHAAKEESRSALDSRTRDDSAPRAVSAETRADLAGGAQQQLPGVSSFARQFSAELARNRPEGSLRPRVGGVAGGTKVVDTGNGMFFKIADDGRGVFQGLSVMQGKPAKREASVGRWLCARYTESSGLMVSPSAVTDIIARNGDGHPVAVYRVMASLNLSVGEETLRLGSSDGGVTAHSCAAVAKRARGVANLCHIAPSRFRPSNGHMLEHTRLLTSAGRKLTPDLPGDGQLLEWLEALGAGPKLYSTEKQCAELEALLGVRLDPLYHFTAKWEIAKLPVLPSGSHEMSEGAAASSEPGEADEACAAAAAQAFQPGAPAAALAAPSGGSVSSDATSSSRERGQLPLPFDVEVHGMPSGQLLIVDAHRLAIPEVPVVQWGTGIVVGTGLEGTYVSSAAATTVLEGDALVAAVEAASRAHGGPEAVCLLGDDDVAGMHARQCGAQLLCGPDGRPAALLPQPQKLWAAPFITALFPPGAGMVLRSLGAAAVSPDDVFTDNGKTAVAATAALLGPGNTAAAARAVLAEVEATAGALKSNGADVAGDTSMHRLLSLRDAVKRGLHARGLGLRHVAFVHAAAARGVIGRSALLDEALVCACLPRPGSCAGVAIERLAGLGEADWPVAVIAARTVASKGRTTSARDVASLAQLVVRHASLCHEWLSLQQQRGSSAFLQPAAGARPGSGEQADPKSFRESYVSGAVMGVPDRLAGVGAEELDDDEGGFVFASAGDDDDPDADDGTELAAAEAACQAPVAPVEKQRLGCTTRPPWQGTPAGGDFSAAVRTAARELRWCQALVTEELELVLPLQQLLLAAVESGASELSALVALQLLVLLWRYSAPGSEERRSEAMAIGEAVRKAEPSLGEAIVSATSAGT